MSMDMVIKLLQTHFSFGDFMQQKSLEKKDLLNGGLHVVGSISRAPKRSESLCGPRQESWRLVARRWARTSALGGGAGRNDMRGRLATARQTPGHDSAPHSQGGRRRGSPHPDPARSGFCPPPAAPSPAPRASELSAEIAPAANAGVRITEILTRGLGGQTVLDLEHIGGQGSPESPSDFTAARVSAPIPSDLVLRTGEPQMPGLPEASFPLKTWSV